MFSKNSLSILLILTAFFASFGGVHGVMQVSINNSAVSTEAGETNSGNLAYGALIKAPLTFSQLSMNNKATFEQGTANAGSIASFNQVAAPVILNQTYSAYNSVSGRLGRAVSGSALLLDETSSDLSVSVDSQLNQARIGYGDAISGNEFHLGNVVSNIDINTSSTRNEAVIKAGAAASGLEVNFNYVGNSDISIIDSSFDNYVNIENGNETSTGVSGSQVNILEAMLSNVTLQREVVGNSAYGNEGLLLAGIQTNVRNTNQSHMTTNDVATNNKVGAGNDTNAISGVQFNGLHASMQETDLTSQSDSNVVQGEGGVANVGIAGVQVNQHSIGSSVFTTTSTSTNNVANLEKGSAISGIQNNVVTSSNMVDQSASSITMINGALLNEASTSDLAIAGVQNHFNQVNNTSLTLTNEAKDNFANSTDGTAVAGVQNNFGQVQDSNVDIENSASNNYAYSGGANRVAVAGIETNIKRLINSNVTIDNEAVQNEGRSIGGSAVAGAQTNVRYIIGSDVTIDNDAFQNEAKSIGGSAVAGAQTNIKGISDNSNVLINNNVGENVAIGTDNSVVTAQTNFVSVEPGSFIITTPTSYST